MRKIGQNGLTMVELLVSMTIMAIIAVAAMVLVSTSLRAHEYGTEKLGLYSDGMMAMARMTDGVRRCTFLLIPNAHNPVRSILAFSGTVNDDNDYYFGDPLFPRIDEDVGSDMDGDGEPGIGNVDDDGDHQTDEGFSMRGVPFGANDDDEDGAYDEEVLDGMDNDGDGNVDEDLNGDMTRDMAAGVKGMDDDGDGEVDEGSLFKMSDDDEDGQTNEDPLNPVIFYRDSETQELKQSIPYLNETKTLATHVTGFDVTYEAPERILIRLTLTGENGNNIAFSEYVCPRNILQKTGKRVR